MARRVRSRGGTSGMMGWLRRMVRVVGGGRLEPQAARWWVGRLPSLHQDLFGQAGQMDRETPAPHAHARFAREDRTAGHLFLDLSPTYNLRTQALDLIPTSSKPSCCHQNRPDQSNAQLELRMDLASAHSNPAFTRLRPPDPPCQKQNAAAIAVRRYSRPRVR